ncbi:MAG: hypothetical protein ACYC2H_05255 [Thermoplasmatota archaeon]
MVWRGAQILVGVVLLSGCFNGPEADNAWLAEAQVRLLGLNEDLDIGLARLDNETDNRTRGEIVLELVGIASLAADWARDNPPPENGRLGRYHSLMTNALAILLEFLEAGYHCESGTESRSSLHCDATESLWHDYEIALAKVEAEVADLDARRSG